METKKQSGTFKLLTVLLCVLLAVSLVFNVVLYVNNNDLIKKADTLTESNATLTTELNDLSDVAAQTAAELLATNETIAQLETEATAAEETIASKAAALAEQKTEFDSLTDAFTQSQAELLTANETIAQLQADLEALQAEAVSDQDPAEDAIVDDEADAQEASVTFTPEDVIATVNGVEITGADVLTSYKNVVNYYGEPDAETLELYYAVAMEEAVSLALIKLAAAEMGVDQFTQEKLDEIYAISDSEWEYALDNYVSYNFAETDETTDEERAAAYAEAEAYYGSMGYTKDTLRASYVDNEVFERLKAEVCRDVTVTDEEVQAYYDEAIQADKEIYESDIDAYESQLMMIQRGYADQEPWYRPEGFRYIKHILLEADAELLAEYTNLAALYKEEESSVTAEEVEAARVAVIESVQATIDEINQKLADGVAFEDLIAEYGTDPGMTSEDYPEGYIVSSASYGFVPEFVAGAFSVDTVGDVSDPFISEYGVHIVKYMADVPSGPVELTDDLRELIYQSLITEKNDEAMNAWWQASADIVYSGIIRPIDEIQTDGEQ